MKVLIQGLGESPATIEFAIKKEKPDITFVICSSYQMKLIEGRGYYSDPSWVVVERAAKQTGTKVEWCICDAFDINTIGQAVRDIFRRIKPTDEVVINYTGGASGVKLLLGAAAVVVSRVMPIRIILSIYYEGGLEIYKDQTNELKTIFEQLYGPFYGEMEKATLTEMVNAMADAMVVLDPEGKLIFANHACSQIFGMEPRASMGKQLVEVLGIEKQNPEEAEKFISLIRRARESGSVESTELAYVRSDGSMIPIGITGGVMRDSQGNPSHIVAVIRNITQLKLAEEERKRALAEKASLIDVMTDNIAVCNLKARLITVNKAFQEHLAGRGINVKELVGKPIYEVMPLARPEDAKKYTNLIKEIMEKEEATPIEVAGRKGGWYSIAAFRLKDAEGEPTGFFTMCRDITQLKRAEEVLREQYTRLKEIDEMKSRFVSIATHELRTPLVSIKGYTSMVRRGYAGEVPKEIDEMLEVVERNADRLSALTNDLLDQQRLEFGRFQISPKFLKLQEIIEEAVQEVQPIVSQKTQSLQVQVPSDLPPVKADKIRMIQVFINLLSNASKFTPTGGSIRLLAREAGEMVEVQVSDNGIGITKEDISKLFTPFPDIKKPAPTHPSTGLGLSICKGIVELHGGRIWAESEGEGKGITFTFSIPK